MHVVFLKKLTFVFEIYHFASVSEVICYILKS